MVQAQRKKRIRVGWGSSVMAPMGQLEQALCRLEQWSQRPMKMQVEREVWTKE